MDKIKETQLINSIYSKIKQISELLKISIEKKITRQVLKCSSEILSQLKTEILPLKSYNQLFKSIFDYILQIQSYFRNDIKNGRNSLDLYNAVQQCVSALPRAYLQIIVGSIILENNSLDKKEILEDLLEACNNIKHPIKGLFLRYFLIKILNNYFTDIELLMENFREMNKLWINIKKLKNISDKNIKIYRNDLKVLMEENISKLNYVLNENNNEDKEIIYKEKILTRILSIVKKCKDEESKEFILICLIQTFNEEYNIKYINEIINTIVEIKENIDIKIILSDIMKKLTKYNKREKIKEIKMNNIFIKINECIMAFINKKLEKISEIKSKKEKNISLDINDKELISLIGTQHSFIKFLTNFCTFENKKEILDILNDNINKLYELLINIKSVNEEINQVSIANYILNNENMINIYDLLNELTLSPFSSIEFKNFPNLMKLLNITFFYELSLNILNNITNQYNLGNINSSEKCKYLVEFLEPIMSINHADLREYLSNKLIFTISKIVFVPSSKDPYEQLDMLQIIKNCLIDSTKNDNEKLTELKKLIYLKNYLNALLLLGLNVSESYENIIKNSKEKKTQIHIDFCNNFNFNNKKFNTKKEETILTFYISLFKEIDSIFDSIKYISAEETFKLYIECSKMINQLKFKNKEKYEDYAYIYINKAIEILKEEKENNDDNKNKDESMELIKLELNKKYDCLTYLIGVVSYMNIFTENHYNLIRENIEKLCDHLSKRSEQSILMLKCLNLYCNEIEIDINKILDLFSKAKKYAVYSMINPENTILFVYILNEYIRLDGYIKDFDKSVKINDIEETIETIENYLTNMKNENKDSKMIKHIEDYYNNTIERIKIIKNKKEKNYKLITNLKLDLFK